jgi:hypothetical protein
LPYKDKVAQKLAVKKLHTRRMRLWKRIVDACKDVPCFDCGKRYPPIVMDYHHPRKKEFQVSDAKYKWHLDKVVLEILECIVLCANCHRLRHTFVEVNEKM